MSEARLPRISQSVEKLPSDRLELPRGVQSTKSCSRSISPVNNGRDIGGAAGLGFEPRLTDPLESVVLPLRQPILYEKVF